MTTQKNTRNYRGRAAKSSASQLDFGLTITDPDKARQKAAVKERKCLSCSKSFTSEGPGNRVCSGCKACVTWSSAANEYRLIAR